jgi:hypothetical protein
MPRSTAQSRVNAMTPAERDGCRRGFCDSERRPTTARTHNLSSTITITALENDYPGIDDTDVSRPRFARVPPMPRDWPPLASAGDTMMRFSRGRASLAFEVEEGTRLAAPLFFGPCTASVTAVLAVTDNPAAVMTAYSQQIESLSDPVVPDARARVRRRRDGSATVLDFNQTISGGVTFSGHLVQRVGSQPWLTIEACQDS